jgi:hypothetical protein
MPNVIPEEVKYAMKDIVNDAHDLEDGPSMFMLVRRESIQLLELLLKEYEREEG